jgi:hypothetical protein
MALDKLDNLPVIAVINGLMNEIQCLHNHTSFCTRKRSTGHPARSLHFITTGTKNKHGCGAGRPDRLLKRIP